MGTILLGLLSLLTLAYLWLRHKYSYWTRQGLPQPPVVFGFGHVLDVVLMRNIPGLIYDKFYKSYPDHDAVGLFEFLTPALLVRSPTLIKRVMASDFSNFHDNAILISEKLDPDFSEDPFVARGEKWKRNRAKLIPSMTSIKIKEIFPLMKEVLQRLDAYLDENETKQFIAKDLAVLFTMDNVSSTVFGISSNCFSDPEAAFRKMSDVVMKEQLGFSWKTMVTLVMPRIRDLLGLRFIPISVKSYVENMVQEVMDYRIKNGVVRNDLFQYFLKKEPDHNLKDMMFYGMTFFIEGFETSAMTASSVLYELALNPNIERTLHEEITQAFGDCSDYDMDTINSLPYLDKVIQESLRKYPVMYANVRECTKAVNLEIDGKTVEVPQGSMIALPVFSIQRDPQYYPDPEVFDPERFSEENKAQRPPYTYFPFGEGPRICPGIRYGMAQVKLFIANIVHKYRIQRCDKTPDRITFSLWSILVVPKEDQWVRIERRK